MFVILLLRSFGMEIEMHVYVITIVEVLYKCLLDIILQRLGYKNAYLHGNNRGGLI